MSGYEHDEQDAQREEREAERQQYFAQAKAIFYRMLRAGKPVAFEDALRGVKTDDWFDRRGFGWIPAGMRRDGEIVEAGFRLSETAKHNNGIKRLWILANAERKGAAQ